MIGQWTVENIFQLFNFNPSAITFTHMAGSVDVVIDQMGRQVLLPPSPQRVVSLVPSQTELLFDLGLSHRIVGVTKFCVHPGEAKKKEIIGGTKKFNLDKIRSLKPDLIIGNKEENYKEGIEALSSEFPVWMSDIFTLEDATAMMERLGEILNCQRETKTLTGKIKRAFQSLSRIKRGRALYLIWQKPYMVAGANTFIHNMLERAGFTNAAEDFRRYPEMNLTQMQELNPNYVLLSSEPYPFKEKHLHDLAVYFPNSKMVLVDGEHFSWYGSRLLKAAHYFQKLNLS